MTGIGRDLVGWTEVGWRAVQNAVDQALAGTAKCRQVIPAGDDRIGEKAVVIPRIGGTPIAYQRDAVETPVHIYVDADLDDQHAQTDAEIIRLMEAAAAQVGAAEDVEIIQGAGGPAGAAQRVARTGGLARGRGAAAAPGGARLATRINAAVAGRIPTLDELHAALATAVGVLEGADRPGQFGLLLHSSLMAMLRQPRVPGGVPLIREVEGLIGGNQIAGTSALDGRWVRGNIGAILFRLRPAAMDLVHTMLPTVTILGRAAGLTTLRIEEEIALRDLDPVAIERIAY